MPKCYYCCTSVPGPDLKEVQRDQLACSDCRQPTEVTVAQRKPVISLQVFEVEEKTPDGKSNYEIEASVKLGSLKLEWSTTTDDVRTYFTERRVEKLMSATAEGETPGLRAVKRKED